MGIKEITQGIETLISTYTRAPFNELSKIIMICSLARRPGLSTILSTARIINNLTNYGIKTDDMDDGQKNQLNIFVKVTVDEIFRALREDAKIQTVSNIGSTQSTGVVGPGGSVVVTQSTFGGGHATLS